MKHSTPLPIRQHACSLRTPARKLQRARGSQGQSLLEFALVLPLLLLMLILIITVPGFAAWDHLVAATIADQAAQDGANAAAGAPFEQIQTIACATSQPEATQQIRANGLTLQQLSVSCQVINTADPRACSELFLIHSWHGKKTLPQ